MKNKWVESCISVIYTHFWLLRSGYPMNQYLYYPPGNDHISPLFNGHFESMIFRTSQDGIWYVNSLEGNIDMIHEISWCRILRIFFADIIPPENDMTLPWHVRTSDCQLTVVLTCLSLTFRWRKEDRSGGRASVSVSWVSWRRIRFRCWHAILQQFSQDGRPWSIFIMCWEIGKTTNT